MPMLKDDISNAIRCARFKVKKSQTQLIVAAAMGDKEESDDHDDMARFLSQDDGTF